MARNYPRHFIETHPEILPLLHFLKTYKTEWTVLDLSRDYPKYREEKIASYIVKLRTAGILTRGKYISVPGYGERRPLWKLSTNITTLLEQ